MGKFYPSEREKEQVFHHLPEAKEPLIQRLIGYTGMTEKYARSLIWNMKRVGLLYTNEKHQLAKTNEG